MWFGKFSRLLYIAYLDCERSIKNISFVVIGILSGFLFFSLFIPRIDVPLDVGYVLYSIVTIATWNALLITAFAYFWILLMIFVYSVFRAAYLYDNKVWGYVKSVKGSGTGFVAWFWRGYDKINKQAEIDKMQTESERYNHTVLIDALIEELKKE